MGGVITRGRGPGPRGPSPGPRATSPEPTRILASIFDHGDGCRDPVTVSLVPKRAIMASAGAALGLVAKGIRLSYRGGSPARPPPRPRCPPQSHLLFNYRFPGALLYPSCFTRRWKVLVLIPICSATDLAVPRRCLRKSTGKIAGRPGPGDHPSLAPWPPRGP